jgi:hypothetical protein
MFDSFRDFGAAVLRLNLQPRLRPHPASFPEFWYDSAGREWRVTADRIKAAHSGSPQTVADAYIA